MHHVPQTHQGLGFHEADRSDVAVSARERVFVKAFSHGAFPTTGAQAPGPEENRRALTLLGGHPAVV